MMPGAAAVDAVDRFLGASVRSMLRGGVPWLSEPLSAEVRWGESLPVCVSGTTSGNPAGTGCTSRWGGSHDLEAVDDSGSEQLSDPAEDLGGEEPHLSGPRRRLGAEEQFPLPLGLPDAVGRDSTGQFWADDLDPSGDDRSRADLRRHSVVSHPTPQDVIDRLRITIVPMGAGVVRAGSLPGARPLLPGPGAREKSPCDVIVSHVGSPSRLRRRTSDRSAQPVHPRVRQR